MKLAAVIGSSLLVLLAAFQLALAAGAPWGRAAYGGVWKKALPMGIRINSLVFGAVLYPMAILYLLHASGIRETTWLPGSVDVVMWVLVAFFTLGSVANFASRSKPERWWGPFALGVAVCCAVIALG